MSESSDAVLLRCLLGGLALEDFESTILEKVTRKSEASFELALLEQILDFRRLERLLAQPQAAAHIDIVGGPATKVSLGTLVGESSTSQLDGLLEHFRNGSTLRMRHAQRLDAQLQALTCSVGRLFAAQSFANVYLTPPGGVGFAPHYDVTDVFIVQCAGRKEWRILSTDARVPALPSVHAPLDPGSVLGVLETYSLTPGDVLYIPRGVVHQAHCTDQESLHLSLGVAPMTWLELMNRALLLAGESDVRLRRRVPWSLGREPAFGALSEDLRALLGALRELVNAEALARAEYAAQHARAVAPGDDAWFCAQPQRLGALPPCDLARAAADLRASCRAVSTERTRG